MNLPEKKSINEKFPSFVEMKGGFVGFSKMNREQRISILNNWLAQETSNELDSYLHINPTYQKAFSEFSENYITNYFLPFGIIPNVVVNDKSYLVPFVTEESSVVAAASRAARFWANNGGFKTNILGTQKKGQVHFTWSGKIEFLHFHFKQIETLLYAASETLTLEMQKRGGGITQIEFLDKSQILANYFQIDVTFETADAMGANFINSCLETMAHELENYLAAYTNDGKVEVIMSILSNYTPGNVVKCVVECPIEALAEVSKTYSPVDFARRFHLAVLIAQNDIARAVTHNKGIYNGIDGVVLATGNDWRAVEANGHAYASKQGKYTALSSSKIENGIFYYELIIPLSIGTVGGITKNHPLSRFALKLLSNPTANELMSVIAAVGMANNFSAISSLVTSGIQKGHMKMHLNNMLSSLGASEEQKQKALGYFGQKTVSYAALRDFLVSKT